MLIPLSEPDARELLAFFENAGYTEPNLRSCMGSGELLSKQLRNEVRLLDRTREATPANILIRWFWLARTQTLEEVAPLISERFLTLLLACGLLRADPEGLTANAMLLPYDQFLVASDHPAAIERQDAGMVLWPNPTSKFLTRFAVRRRSRATLDLGTGSGILSLGAARYSDQVVATDLNQRAVEFAQFNASFNGVRQIEVLAGDCFEPVAGRSFDLILCNPPFFITPETDYMFCDNPMELDQFSRRLVKEGPAYLNEGGYMEMLCEWAQVNDEPWEERVAEWIAGNGCDAWVMKGLTQDPAEYAQHRIREVAQDSGRDAELYAGYMSYYRKRGVKAIHDGLIVMRRRSGANWVRIEEVPKTPTGDLGELVLNTFAAQDLLIEMEADEKLLAARPKLAAHVRLEQICEQAEGRWRAESVTLRLISGFPFHVTVQPLVAEFLATCDGSRTAREAIEAFASNAGAPPEIVRKECLSILRKLIERGFLVVAAD